MIDLSDRFYSIAVVAIICAALSGIIVGFLSANPPLDPDEILKAERGCRQIGKQPSYFRSASYKDIRQIVCEDESRTVYY